jgi:CrcB protein
MKTLLAVCLGGACGSGLRYLIGLGLPRLLGSGFPYATLSVNLSGSFLMGLLMGLSLQFDNLSPLLRLGLTTGLLGGLTTYSSFNHETLTLWQQGQWRLAVLNLSLTLSGGLLAGSGGLWCASWLSRSV